MKISVAIATNLLTGVVPATCDAEAGEFHEGVVDRMDSMQCTHAIRLGCESNHRVLQPRAESIKKLLLSSITMSSP